MYRVLSVLLVGSLLASSIFLAGCGGASGTASQDSADEQEAAPQVAESPNAGKKSFQRVQLGGGNGETEKQSEYTADDVRQALREVQVVVGQWKGTPFQATVFEQITWKWDHETNPQQPALVFESDKGPELRSGRLTYLPASEQFQLTAETPEGQERVLKGRLVEDVRKVPDPTGESQQLHTTFKLQLVEEQAPEGEKPWKVTLEQQHNHRYQFRLEEVGETTRKRLAMLGVQREGTSFVESRYGSRTCIVSEGLGTRPVEYQGKTYYVCCSGCEAAFEDDPEFWIAKQAEREKE